MRTASIQKLRLRIILAVAVLIAMFGLLAFHSPAHVSALNANQQAICDSIGSGTDCGTSSNGNTDVNSVIRTAINLFSGIVGVVAVIMIVTAGFKYITSGGDSAKLTSAKNTLVYALIGIVIVVLSQAIVKFTLTKTLTVSCPTGQKADSTGQKCIPG